MTRSGRRILGLSAGNPDGSADILLKEALRAAEDSGADVHMVRVDDLNLSIGPATASTTDDAQWFWDQLMESDGLIVSTPIYTRTIPGKLRLLGDKISGPQADVAFTSELLRMRAAGEAIPVQFAIDERVLRPRVGAFIVVGGSLPFRWKTLAMPLMHSLTASMQVGIVDQVQFAGAGSPASIVLDDGALARAQLLGGTVASQLGRSFDEIEYRGDPGLCPLCHLDVIVFGPEGVECASCGAGGELEVVDGVARVVFPAAGLERSAISLAEKYDHFLEVQQTAAAHAPERARIDAAAERYRDWERSLLPPRD
ncbi:MAG: NAD(P)H-dependent oxidoreductase [Actinomycetota bacterium]|nr:NAD(P)H-dependent oxidoreductase [Actinomycetota bacterium]